MANQYFNLRTAGPAQGWITKTDNSWGQLLRDNGMWMPNKKNGSDVDATWYFTVPTDAYYAVNCSCDDSGSVWVDDRQVLNNSGLSQAWTNYVYLKAGQHKIRTYGKDGGKGSFGLAVTVESCNVFFNLQQAAVGNGWQTRDDGGWYSFLRTNGTWPNQKGGNIDGTWKFTVPAKAYYTINGSCDDNGVVYIDNKQLLSIKDYKSMYSASVLLEAGEHTIRVTGHDGGGNYGCAVTVTGDVQAQVDAQNASAQATANANAAKSDYDTKQAQAVSAQAAVGTKVTTDVKITYNNGPVSASGSASGSASASAGAEAHAGVDGNYASAGASAHAEAGVEASASGSASVGNSTGSIGASGSASGYANASADASAEAGAGLQGNNATAGASVDIVVRTEAGVSAQAQADATLLGIQLAEAQAQGSASTYTEVYVHADGSVTVGENGATIQAGAIAGYGVGAGAQGSASVDTALGGASVSGKTEVSIGAQVGAEGEAHATYQDGKISIGISGEAALLVGLDADIDMDIDIGPTIDAVNAALNSGKTINEALSVATTGLNQTAVAYNKTQDELQKFADQCLKAAKDAEKVYNDAVKGATDAANQVVNVTNTAIKQTEQAFTSAGNQVVNGVVQLGNSVAKAADDAAKAVNDFAKDVGNALNPKNWF